MKIALQTAVSRETRPAQPSISSREFPTPLPQGSRLPALDPGSPTVCERLLDDAAIIARVNRGDHEATSALVARLTPTVLKCVRRRLPRWASEEDLVQTAFGKVFAKLDQFSGSVPLEHWVSRIAVNTSLNQLNHEATRPELRMSDLSEEQEAMVHNLFASQAGGEQDDARELIALLLAQLTPGERRIVVLLHLEQRSTREISRMTGLSISLIKVRAFRARHKMRRIGRKLLREATDRAGVSPATAVSAAAA